jgi:hypothetical protein
MQLKQLTQKAAKAKPISFYRPGRVIRARNTTYKLSKPYGKIRDGRFSPQLTPQQMLEKGVFEGRYINNDTAEFPRQWFEAALSRKKLSPEKADVEVNMFKIKSRLPLSEWRLNGWVPSSKKVTRRRQYDILSSSKNPDTKGWFQWYCRYFIGRRLPELDAVQKKRWIAFTRHAGAVRKNCTAGDLKCRPRQRQALLQWAYRPTI